jgi:hypothetical protein
MISEKTHLSLSRALNDMTTLLSKEHSETQFKWKLLHILREMSEVIVQPSAQTPETVVYKDKPAAEKLKNVQGILEDIHKAAQSTPATFKTAGQNCTPKEIAEMESALGLIYAISEGGIELLHDILEGK